MKMKVLVVDDEKLIRWSVQRLLIREGNEVDIASALEEAASMLEAGNYDLVLCDYIMPDGFGSALLEKMRDSGISAKVVMMSGNIPSDAVADCKADGFIEKPFRLKELKAVIKGIFE